MEGEPTAPPMYPDIESQNQAYQQPAQPVAQQPPGPSRQYAPSVIYVERTVPVQGDNQIQRDNEWGVAPLLYSASCAVFFIPFGWVIGIVALCWYSRLGRLKSHREETAYRFLNICMLVNFLLWILVIIFTA